LSQQQQQHHFDLSNGIDAAATAAITRWASLWRRHRRHKIFQMSLTTLTTFPTFLG